jgi:hypothetical protein
MAMFRTAQAKTGKIISVGCLTNSNILGDNLLILKIPIPKIQTNPPLISFPLLDQISVVPKMQRELAFPHGISTSLGKLSIQNVVNDLEYFLHCQIFRVDPGNMDTSHVFTCIHKMQTIAKVMYELNIFHLNFPIEQHMKWFGKLIENERIQCRDFPIICASGYLDILAKVSIDELERFPEAFLSICDLIELARGYPQHYDVDLNKYGTLRSIVAFLDIFISKIRPLQGRVIGALFGIALGPSGVGENPSLRTKCIQFYEDCFENMSFAESWIHILRAVHRSTKFKSELLPHLLMVAKQCMHRHIWIPSASVKQAITIYVNRFQDVYFWRTARGLGIRTIPTKRQEAEEYYRRSLGEVEPLQNHKDVAQLILEFTIDGYSVGQWVDVKDSLSQWNVSIVLEVGESNQIKVHYIGWSARLQEWVSADSNNVAPAFTFTRVEPTCPNGIEPEMLETKQLKSLSLQSKNLFSEEYCRPFLNQYDDSMLWTRNGLIWKNRGIFNRI